MSREILFRGKRLDNGGWETGSLIIIRWGCSDARHYITDKMTGYPTPIDPATVGQYVFLEDVNDKKIFTGDILKDPDREGEYVIDFIGGGFGLFTMKEYIDLKHKRAVILWDGLSEPQTAFFVTQNLKVIGNIHDKEEAE